MALAGAALANEAGVQASPEGHETAAESATHAAAPTPRGWLGCKAAARSA